MATSDIQFLTCWTPLNKEATEFILVERIIADCYCLLFARRALLFCYLR